MKNLLLKIRELPDRQRKVIFWAVMVVLGLTLAGFYIRNVQKKIPNINIEKTKEELQLPSLGEELEKLPDIEFPKIEIPEVNQEALQELQRMMEKTSTEATNCQPTE